MGRVGHGLASCVTHVVAPLAVLLAPLSLWHQRGGDQTMSLVDRLEHDAAVPGRGRAAAVLDGVFLSGLGDSTPASRVTDGGQGFVTRE